MLACSESCTETYVVEDCTHTTLFDVFVGHIFRTDVLFFCVLVPRQNHAEDQAQHGCCLVIVNQDESSPMEPGGLEFFFNEDDSNHEVPKFHGQNEVRRVFP